MNSPRIPIAQWGKDHWTLLAYVESRCVDHRGVLKNANLRTNVARHPLFVARGFASPGDGSRYPTRYKGGELDNHDDWDCLDDMVRAGLITIVKPKGDALWNVPFGARGPIKYGNGLQTRELTVKVKLTDRGARMAGELRTHLTKTHRAALFTPSFNCP